MVDRPVALWVALAVVWGMSAMSFRCHRSAHRSIRPAYSSWLSERLIRRCHRRAAFTGAAAMGEQWWRHRLQRAMQPIHPSPMVDRRLV
uniref:Putative secreted protein n=1 Tax=Anopheles darlingi TaxID=43151 RepID=A0A2M4D8G4_ANODA